MAYRIPYILDLHRVSAAMHRLRQTRKRRPARSFRVEWPRRQRALLLWLLSWRRPRPVAA